MLPVLSAVATGLELAADLPCQKFEGQNSVVVSCTRFKRRDCVKQLELFR
jgi:hypothetical protein